MNKFFIALVVIYFLISLVGCAPTIYKYEHTKSDGSICKIYVESTRGFSDGTVIADENCALSGGMTEAKTNQAASEMAGTITGAAIKAILGKP